MRFARLAAATVAVLVALTPIAVVVRSAIDAFVLTPERLDSPAGLASYAGLLFGAYAVLVGLLWLVRKVLADVLGTWPSSELAPLDENVHGGWPLPWALVLGGALIWVTAHGTGDTGPRVVEVCVAVVAVVVALAPGARPAAESAYDPLPPLPIPANEPGPVPDDDAIPLTLSWYFSREPGNAAAPPMSCTVKLHASRARYEGFRSQDHGVSAPTDYVRFVRDGGCPELVDVARQIRAHSEAAQLGAIGEINNVLAFAQRCASARDQVDRRPAACPRFPLETLVDGRGDGEDHAILAVACLRALGYEARLVVGTDGTSQGHMALAVAGPDDLPGGWFLRDPVTGQRFYYCEASTDAASRDAGGAVFRMGEAPNESQQARLLLLPQA